MNTSIVPDNAAISVFVLCFVATIVLGSTVRLWRPLLNRRKAATRHTEGEEWGLGGREFGAWVTWFLVGGDFYTAYTVIAVPALVYSTGGFGFFALPYTIIVYPSFLPSCPAYGPSRAMAAMPRRRISYARALAAGRWNWPWRLAGWWRCCPTSPCS
ncbi:sodium:solute symporter [Komagataeibacter intermedius AF2]|uniref:Sodium:solute symporter n=1 Tax=Komagataeibacter intermedius AF2 TaxID=1458464 RepID=A0A0N1N4C3_9PROT|nr:sodium:solute symporter [Komagataeibacter intermedius AF2]